MTQSLDSTELSSEISSKPGNQFGTFKGVYIPSILTILGVIMYLRMGWVVGNAGLFGTIVIVTLSSAITFLTALSISATATNMKVEGGGAYYMIARSFGAETGAGIGLPLFFAQALGISFYISGFSEAVNAVFPSISMQWAGIVSLVGLTALAYASASLALKAQFFIFGMIALSLVSFFMGGPVTVSENIQPLTDKASFWMVFAVFFPAVTGIEAGISMSGDLKNPARSLPWGTLAAVVTGLIVYLAIPIVLAQWTSREVLATDLMIMKNVARWESLILIGVWGASLSSALGALLGAPRTLQALARDRILPQFLGKGYGSGDEPRIATALCFLIALAGVLLGDLDLIAPILSMFFLTSYGALNIAAGVEGLIGNPSWRPSFKTPWVLSFIGAFACIFAMFMINSGATFIAGVAVLGVYFWMQKRQLDPRWDDMRRSILLTISRHAIYRLSKYGPNPRSWRPNILLLSGSPTLRWYLVELADAITHGKGFLTITTIVSGDSVDEERIRNLEKSTKEFVNKKGVPSLVEVFPAKNLIAGTVALMRGYGIGPIFPNTVMLGETEKKENYAEYAELILNIYRARRNLLMVRESSTDEVAEKNSSNQVWKSEDKIIDVWWGRQRSNAGLMLAIAYMLQTSPEWSGSRLVLKSLVDNEDQRQGALDHLHDFIKSARLRIDYEVITRTPDEDSFLTIRKSSKNADLVFIGMRPPEEEEEVKSYTEYYSKLIRGTDGFPKLVIAMAAENVEFDQIFN